MDRLRRVATVQSGRPGIAADLAPPEVLAVVAATWPGDVAAAFVSEPSGLNLRVQAVRDGGAAWTLGEVHVPPGGVGARVLSAM